MTLEKKSQNLIYLIQEKRKLRENVDQTTAFQSRKQEFDDQVRRLRSLVNTLMALHSKKIIHLNELPEEVKRSVKVFQQQIQEIQTNFTRNPSWLIDPRGYQYKPLQKCFESLIENLKFLIQTEWNEYAKVNAPKINHELLSVLGKIPKLDSDIRKIRTQDAKITRLKNQTTITIEEIEEFETLVKSVNGTWHNLTSDEIPEEVIQFLRAITTDGSPLDLLTETVRAWLIKSGITESFRIVISKPTQF